MVHDLPLPGPEALEPEALAQYPIHVHGRHLVPTRPAGHSQLHWTGLASATWSPIGRSPGLRCAGTWIEALPVLAGSSTLSR